MQLIGKYGGATSSPRTTAPAPIVWNKIPLGEILLNPGKGFGFFDDFLTGFTASTGGTTYNGTSGQWIASAVTAAGDIEPLNLEGGALWLETAATENNGMQIQSPENFVIDTDCSLAFGARIATVDADQGELHVCLTTVDTDVSGSNANDFVGFTTADEAATLNYMVQTGGAGTATTTGITLANTTYNNLEVLIEGEEKARLYVDGVLVATIDDDTSTDITDGLPTDTVMALSLGCLTGEGTDNGIYLDWAYCYQWYH